MAKKQPVAAREGASFKAFRKYLTILREEQFKETVDRARRKAIASRKRRKLFEDLSEKAGFDISRLDALHAKDWESISKPSKRQVTSGLRLDKLERECQRLGLSAINKHRDRFEYKKGNPQTSICRWTAVNLPSAVINPQTFNNGNVTVVTAPVGTAAVGQNNLRTRIRVQANLPNPSGLVPAAAVDIFTRHTFEAQVPHDGVLSVVAEYSPMGNIFLGAPGDCVLPGESSAEVLLFMFVEIETPAGDVLE